MKLNVKIFNSVLCFYVFLLSQTAFCEVRLPRLISDGMVLQRETDVKIWGWANPGEKVSINFNGKKHTTTTGECGKWTVTLSDMKAGGPYNMEINASNNITIRDILIGDVWVCSGQSNMVLPMKRVEDLYEEEITNALNPFIRHFLVPQRYDFNVPREDLKSGNWESTNPESILHFTATGYFFAKALYEKYQVPIGLINASIGGTPIDAWMSNDALKEFPASLEIANKFKDSAYVNKIIREDKIRIGTWYNRLKQLDKGYENPEKTWFSPDHDASEWPTMQLPAYWEDEGLKGVDGVVWFRKEINVPASMIGKPARLLMGRIVDSDSVYVNGKFVGTISYQYPPRKYDIPKDLLKEGKNTIVVRVVNNIGKGGFVKDKPYKLTVGENIIDLKGQWQYKLGAEMDSLPGQTFIQYKPSGLYNGMIAPLLNYRIKGVIWYQGESNTWEPIEYQKLFPALINDWRKNWHQGNFPFLFAQLHNFMEAKDEPSESNWALLREAQLKTLAVPNTSMAVTIDIGEWNDIHPLNKKDVGRRLALAAQKIAYSEKDIVYSGPIYKDMKTKGNKIILTFTNTGSGLVVKGGGKLNHFAICGPDKKFVWGEAKIENDKVIVWNDNIPNPVAVRYAWADNPEGANLYNKEGLPASPFRTDNE
jgi:sialate O-acetylesterase